MTPKALTPAKKKTADKKRKAIDAYAEWGTVRRAYLAADVSRDCIYKWLRDDAEFKQLWEFAKEDHDDLNYENLIEQSRNGDSKQRFVASATVVNNTHPSFMSSKMYVMEQVAMPLVESLVKEAQNAIPADAAATLAARLTAKADSILSSGLIRK